MDNRFAGRTTLQIWIDQIQDWWMDRCCSNDAMYGRTTAQTHHSHGNEEVNGREGQRSSD
jgi:hypothetical protein